MSSMFNINDFRGEEKKEGKKNEAKKTKFNFKLHKDNTLKSLKEVNSFLSDFNRVINYITLYKILK